MGRNESSGPVPTATGVVCHVAADSIHMLPLNDLCQVVLVGRVTPGSSIQKELVKEAKLCAAMVVVLGANKKYSFG